MNHARRGQVALRSGVVGTPDWDSYYAIWFDGGSDLAVTDEDRIAVDLTDGLPEMASELTVFAELCVAGGAGSDGIMTSAEFREDFDGDGDYFSHVSSDPPVTVGPRSWGRAYAAVHGGSVAVWPPSPATVSSGGTTHLSAAFSDTAGHSVALWSWDDGAAGGSFDDPNIQDPVYTAPTNSADESLTVTLTVSATCDGPLPVTDSDSALLTVLPETHSVTVIAQPPDPATVPSEGSAQLSAEFFDSAGHGAASWHWHDGGAGGSFAPSAAVQAPTYTSPPNTGPGDMHVTLTVTATCDGPDALSDNDETSLTVVPETHALVVAADPVVPSAVDPGEEVALGASFSDSQGHGGAWWLWEDGGAGGIFLPSADVQYPTYLAPDNISGAPVEVTLTVSAACNGPLPAVGTDSVIITVQPVAHTLRVAPGPWHGVVYSGASTQYAANCSDSMGHNVEFAWDDGGAGGAFLPSADVANPVYIAPHNLTESDMPVTVTLTAVCDGDPPLEDYRGVELTVRPASAEMYVEGWRSPFGVPRSIAVNPTDGSFWLANGGSVIHADAEGNIMTQIDGLGLAVSVSVNESDGSCWVAATRGVMHFAEDGTELVRVALQDPYRVSVNPADGSCWVATAYFWAPYVLPNIRFVVRLAEDGTELARADDLGVPMGLAVDPNDGSCWVAYFYGLVVVRLDENCNVLSAAGEIGAPLGLSVDPVDGSCWVNDIDLGDPANSRVVKLAPNCSVVQAIEGLDRPYFVSLDVADGSLWVYTDGDRAVRHFTSDGAEICPAPATGFEKVWSISANAADHSCWVLDIDGEHVVRLGRDCAEQLPIESFLRAPVALAVNPSDNSLWVADGGARSPTENQVVHIVQRDDSWAEGCRIADLNRPSSVSVDPRDDSCWVGTQAAAGVYHLEQDCNVLCSTAPGRSVSVDSADGSCWVVVAHNRVVHLHDDCTRWCDLTGFSWAGSVSANPADGSCWLSDSWDDVVMHIAHATDCNMTVLGSNSDLGNPGAVCVDPTDGSCWVGDSLDGRVVHLNEDCTERCSIDPGRFAEPVSVSVDTSDSSCWLSYDTSGSHYSGVMHVDEDCRELWRGGGFVRPAKVCANPNDHSCWVADRGNGQVVHLVRGHPLALSGYGGSVRVNGILRDLPWAGEFEQGVVVELEAVPDEGYTFSGWSGDIDGADPANPLIAVTMDRYRSITADFLQTWFEDDDPAIVYTATEDWHQLEDPRGSAGHLKYSNRTGARAELTFDGTGLRWHLAVGPMGGMADIYLDGGYVGRLDLYRPGLGLTERQRTGLALGPHTVTIEVSGEKNPSSTGYFVDIDAFEVVP